MVNRKARRHSGRVYSRTTIKAKKKPIIDNCLEPQEHWDDWVDWRDGMRFPGDRTKLRQVSKGNHDYPLHFDKLKYNKKIKKQLIARGVRKKKRLLEKLREFTKDSTLTDKEAEKVALRIGRKVNKAVSKEYWKSVK